MYTLHLYCGPVDTDHNNFVYTYYCEGSDYCSHQGMSSLDSVCQCIIIISASRFIAIGYHGCFFSIFHFGSPLFLVVIETGDTAMCIFLLCLSAA